MGQGTVSTGAGGLTGFAGTGGNLTVPAVLAGRGAGGTAGTGRGPGVTLTLRGVSADFPGGVSSRRGVVRGDASAGFDDEPARGTRSSAEGGTTMLWPHLGHFTDCPTKSSQAENALPQL